MHTLLDHDLVDELRLMVFPVTIGPGLRMFPETLKKSPWKAVDSVTFPSQVRLDTYHRTRLGRSRPGRKRDVTAEVGGDGEGRARAAVAS